MTPQTITRHGWTVTLAGDDTEGYTCTITPGKGCATVAADGPTPMQAVRVAFRASVNAGDPFAADILDALLALALGQEP